MGYIFWSTHKPVIILTVIKAVTRFVFTISFLQLSCLEFSIINLRMREDIRSIPTRSVPTDEFFCSEDDDEKEEQIWLRKSSGTKESDPSRLKIELCFMAKNTLNNTKA